MLKYLDLDLAHDILIRFSAPMFFLSILSLEIALERKSKLQIYFRINIYKLKDCGFQKTQQRVPYKSSRLPLNFCVSDTFRKLKGKEISKKTNNLFFHK